MDMPAVNLVFAWWWMALGALSGAAAGMVFHREDALGGYASWTRRLMRLGHIAFFGTGLLNLAFALTLSAVALDSQWMRPPSMLLIAGGVAMPLVCYLAAWRKPLRHLFIVPVLCLAVGLFLTALAVTSAG